MSKHYQHGDISFHSIDELPANLKEIEQKGQFIIAEGETTGHCHRLKGNFKIFQDKDNNFVLQSNGCEIEHWNKNTNQKAEHNTLTIPAKKFFIVKRENEYNPFDEAVRKAQD